MKLLVVLMILPLVGCEQRQDLLQCTSRDGSNRATYYRLYGGGVLGWQYENVAVQHGLGAPEEVLSLEEGDPDVTLEWRANSTLHIGYPASFEIEESKNKFNGGSVEFEPLPSSTGSLPGGSKCIPWPR